MRPIFVKRGAALIAALGGFDDDFITASARGQSKAFDSRINGHLREFSSKLKLDLPRSPPDWSDDNLDIVTEPGNQFEQLSFTDPTELAARDARDF